MKLEASDITSDFSRPHIKKGFYTGTLVDVKDKKTEGKYGKQLVFVFKIEGTNIDGQPAELARIAYSEYKQEDGTYRTALTKNSLIASIFEALGWTFDPKGCNTDDFLGKQAEVLVNDYEYSYTDPASKQTVMGVASTIDEVKPLVHKVASAK